MACGAAILRGTITAARFSAAVIPSTPGMPIPVLAVLKPSKVSAVLF